MIKRTKTFENPVELSLPSDKSISHRSILFAALSKGKSKISSLLESEDTLNTLKNVQKIGVSVEKESEGCYILNRTNHFFIENNTVLNFGNSGTGIRLSAGLISGMKGLEVVLEGDSSLNQRPMKRIIEPLQKMGATIKSLNKKGTAPIFVKGRKLKDFSYQSNISSAQIKSCLIFAALSSQVKLQYCEPFLSRDHTEQFLKYLGLSIQKTNDKNDFFLLPPYEFDGFEVEIPNDPSSAMFFIVLGLLLKKGKMILKNINLNPIRVESIEILKKMGGKIKIVEQQRKFGEFVGDVCVESSNLIRIEITKEKISSIIDEIPILTIAGLFCENGFCIRNAKELRVKESDRIRSMVQNLRKLNIEVQEYEDGYEFGKITEIEKKIKLKIFYGSSYYYVFFDIKICFKFGT